MESHRFSVRIIWNLLGYFSESRAVYTPLVQTGSWAYLALKFFNCVFVFFQISSAIRRNNFKNNGANKAKLELVFQKLTQKMEFFAG